MDAFARRLLRWHARHGRHDLPWQRPRTPYRVWVSEVMLQQTQVATVIPYFQRFVAALPDVRALAGATEDQVLALWSGLGYYRRARFMHAAAQTCVARHGSQLPAGFEQLAALPGIGRSTAGAILALAHGQRHPILDGNAKRVLARFHGIRGWPGERSIGNALWKYADAHTPAARVADYTQAIMDLGATVCTRSRPRCDECPLAPDCAAHADGLTGAIPAPAPKRAVPERRTLLLVLRDRRGRVLLERRPPQGVWPGLWSLPEAPDERSAAAHAARLGELDDAPATELPEVRHAFTHFRLIATPLLWCAARPRNRIADDGRVRWCSRAEIATLGLPAPIRRLLTDVAARV